MTPVTMTPPSQPRVEQRGGGWRATQIWKGSFFSKSQRANTVSWVESRVPTMSRNTGSPGSRAWISLHRSTLVSTHLVFSSFLFFFVFDISSDLFFLLTV